MGVMVLLADDGKFAEVLLASLHRLLVHGHARERDRLAVGGPGEIADAVLGAGQLCGLASLGGDNVNLAFVAGAIAGECKPAAVRRPVGIAGGLFTAGELHGFAALGVSQPELRDKRVLLEVG